MIYRQLFFTFLKMGMFTFGGGYAMLPILESEVVQKKGWISMEEMMDFYALGQVFPGIIALNMANFIGYRQRGRRGALAAVSGFVLPSIIIIFIIYNFIRNFSDLEIVQHAFVGIRLAVGALILNTIIKMIKKGVVDALTLVLCAVCFVMLFVFKLHPVIPIVSGALVGLMFYPGGKA